MTIHFNLKPVRSVDTSHLKRAEVDVVLSENQAVPVYAIRKFWNMKFHQTNLAGAFEIEIEPKNDERGFFARSWCHREFAEHGLNPGLVQCNISFSTRQGTLRGLHYQLPPSAEAKLVRCTQGALYDVAVDLRPQSPTFKRWTGAVLNATNRRMLYVPEGCAHGFITLEDNTEIFYQMSKFPDPDSARGVRWDDRSFQIIWPGEVQVISERDRSYPDYKL